MTAAEFRAGRQPPSRPDSRALGRLPVGVQNKTETRYEDEVLKPAVTAGDVLWYRFEGVKLRLADNTFYTADFAIMRADRVIELHDVKGAAAMITEDANVKIKVAADQYPFVFKVVIPPRRKPGGDWSIREVGR